MRNITLEVERLKTQDPEDAQNQDVIVNQIEAEVESAKVEVPYTSEQLHRLIGVSPQRRREYQKIMQKACKEVGSTEYEELNFVDRQKSWEPNQVEALMRFRMLYLPIEQGGKLLTDSRALEYVKKKGIP